MNNTILKPTKANSKTVQVGYCYITYLSTDYVSSNVCSPQGKKHTGEWEVLIHDMEFKELVHTFHKTKEEALEAMRTQLLVLNPYRAGEFPEYDLIVIDETGAKSDTTTTYITRSNKGKEIALSISNTGETTVEER